MSGAPCPAVPLFAHGATILFQHETERMNHRWGTKPIARRNVSFDNLKMKGDIGGKGSPSVTGTHSQLRVAV
jgi:hypothetical protein